jgi:hypothetical protein
MDDEITEDIAGMRRSKDEEKFVTSPRAIDRSTWTHFFANVKTLAVNGFLKFELQRLSKFKFQRFFEIQILTDF